MQGISLTRTAATAGDHIDWMTTSPAAINCTDWSNVVQVARKWPSFFSSISLSQVKSISCLVMLPLLPYLISPALSKHSAASMMPIAGHVEDRGLALEFGIDQILPLGHGVADQVGAIADRVGVVDLRQEVGQPFGDAVVELGRIGLAIYIAS